MRERRPNSYYDKVTTSDAAQEIDELFGAPVYGFPKPTQLISDLLEWPSGNSSSYTALDYFAGSGTTGHAVMKLNRADGGHRKFVLVDFGEFFDSVLKRRISKVMYAPEWKAGVPVRQPRFDGDAPEWVERTPRLVQVVELESFEDSLNSLKGEGAVDGDVIRYVAQVRESSTLLSTTRMERPFDYQLEVHTEEGVNFVDVDLVTTFNLMKGIHPKRYRETEDSGRRYVIVEGVEGSDKVLVVWRNISGLDPEAERDSLIRFVKESLDVELTSYTTIYHNADSALPNSVSLDAEFRRLMFEPEPALA